MSVALQVADVGDLKTVTVVVNGVPYVAASTHPNYEAIVLAAANGDESVVDLFDVAKAVQKKFDRITDRVSISDGVVYLDGDPVHSTLTDQIIRFNEAGEDFNSLIKFYDKLLANPNPHSREQLYNWLNAHNFTITKDGDLIGFKGVKVEEDENGEKKYFSVNSGGTVIVDGLEVTGYVPNELGSIVEMPRSAVEHDPSVGCSTGLHVGTYEYAKDWAKGALLVVVVNPRDVVSVPTDCSSQKLRVCRYRIVNINAVEYTAPVANASILGEDDDDDDCYDDSCDCDGDDCYL